MYCDLGLVSGDQPAGVHKQRVVQQRVNRPNREEGGRQSGQVGVEGRDVRVRALILADEHVEAPVDVRLAQHHVTLAPSADAGRQRQVIGPVQKVRAAVGMGQTMPVAETQQGHRREVRPGRLAAYDQPVDAEFGPGVTGQPDRGSLCVVRRGRIRMLRRQPVVNADDGNFALPGNALQSRVLQVGGALRPTAAVEVQIYPVDHRRREYPQRQPACRTINHPVGGDVGVYDRAEEGLSRPRRLTHRPDASDLRRRYRCQPRLQVSDESLRIRINRRRVECSSIQPLRWRHYQPPQLTLSL